MWQIIDSLFLGTVEDGNSLDGLNAAGISHIVNCAAELPCAFPDRFSYLHLALHDPDEGLHDRIADAVSFIDLGRIHGNVLVYCHGAISRSPAVTLAYLIHNNNTFDVAIGILRASLQTRPNDIFVRQISDYYQLDLTDDDIVMAIDTLGNSARA